jgi:uncharacterized damage-inducible protein DinB
MTYYGARELARSFQTVRRNTLVIAEEIPEEQYSFRPAAGSRSVAETLAHIVMSSRSSYDLHADRRIITFAGIDFSALSRERLAREQTLTAKSEILAALRDDGEVWNKFFGGVSEETLSGTVSFPAPIDPPSKSRFELILGVKEHEMHHRGQLMVCQRMLGLVPHLTRERQARMAPAATAPR